MSSNERDARDAIAAVKAWIAEEGLTIAEFAKTAGVDPQTLSNFLVGKSIPQMRTLSKISEAIGQRRSYLDGLIVTEAFPNGARNVSAAQDTGNSLNGEADGLITRHQPEKMTDEQWAEYKKGEQERWLFELYKAEQEWKRQREEASESG